MSASTRKKVTVQYRKLDDFSGAFGKRTLQQLIAACMSHKLQVGTIGDDPNERRFDADDYGIIVLNYFEDKADFFFGELVRFEPGADLPLLQIGTGVKAYNLTQAKAPHGHEPIRGLLYFMVIDNHVVLIESDVSGARAERYLTWLLTLTSTIKAGSHVILVSELTTDGSMQLSEVEQVVFRPKPFGGIEDLLTDGTASSTSREVAGTNTLEVLKAAGMDDTDIQRMADNDTQLEVTLFIKFKGQRRKKPLSIEDTNRLLRNIPDDELTLSSSGGRQKNGKIEKLSYPANVETIGSFLKPKDVARALYEGYRSFVNNGYID